MTSRPFEYWLLRNGKQTETIKNHLKRLAVLTRSVSLWNIEQLDNFLLDLKKRGRKNSTLNAYIDTIRAWANFQEIEELKKYKYFSVEQTSKSVLTDDEVYALVTMACPTKSIKKQWELDSLFLKMVAYHGCRPGEVANLKKLDITPTHFVIRQTKTGRPRIVPLAEPVRNELMSHLDRIETDLLFITSRGKKYSLSNWQHVWDRRIKLLGINRPNLSIYSLRHSMATELYRRKVPAQVIAKLLGNSIDMVEKTYAHMVIEDVEEALRQHPLIGKRSNPNFILSDLVREIRKFKLENDPRFEVSLEIQSDGVRLTVRIGQNIEDFTSNRVFTD